MMCLPLLRIYILCYFTWRLAECLGSRELVFPPSVVVFSFDPLFNSSFRFLDALPCDPFSRSKPGHFEDGLGHIDPSSVIDSCNFTAPSLDSFFPPPPIPPNFLKCYPDFNHDCRDDGHANKSKAPSGGPSQALLGTAGTVFIILVLVVASSWVTKRKGKARQVHPVDGIRCCASPVQNALSISASSSRTNLVNEQSYLHFKMTESTVYQEKIQLRKMVDARSDCKWENRVGSDDNNNSRNEL